MIDNIESNKVGVDSIIVNKCVDAFIYVMNDIFTNPLDRLPLGFLIKFSTFLNKANSCS